MAYKLQAAMTAMVLVLCGSGVAAQSSGNSDIVVTATPLSQTGDELAACIARNCPAREDIAASLRHAENQFIAGQYDEARSTLNASIRRNRDERLNLPTEVAGLYRATSRVSAHLGDGRAYELGVINMRSVLRDGLPADDERQLHAEIEVADAQRALGQTNYARDRYREVADRAQFLGFHRTAAYAQLRMVSLDLPTRLSDPALQNSRRARDAERLLDRIIAQGDRVGTDVAFLALTLRARADRNAGNMSATNELVTQFAEQTGSARPLLISGDPVRLHDADLDSRARDPWGSSESQLSRLQMSDISDRWIDVGFWIEPDGRVREVELLRSEGDPYWARFVERSILSRVYTPTSTSAERNSPGTYIVERYSLTARIRYDCTGSRLVCRDQQLRVEMLDLTPEMAAAAPGGGTGPA
jgi:hypothetical protein